jgi:hypothetical protein
MKSFVIKEKKLKRIGDLTKDNQKSILPFAIFLVIVFIIAYLYFNNVFFK